MWRQPYRLLVEQPCVPNYAHWKLHYFFLLNKYCSNQPTLTWYLNVIMRKMSRQHKRSNKFQNKLSVREYFCKLKKCLYLKIAHCSRYDKWLSNTKNTRIVKFLHWKTETKFCLCYFRQNSTFSPCFQEKKQPFYACFCVNT